MLNDGSFFFDKSAEITQEQAEELLQYGLDGEVVRLQFERESFFAADLSMSRSSLASGSGAEGEPAWQQWESLVFHQTVSLRASQRLSR